MANKMLMCLSGSLHRGTAVLDGGDTMIGACENCGCTKSQAITNAKSLGLEQEFEKGSYHCCQLMEWADEQRYAWLQAMQDDVQTRSEGIRSQEIENAEAVLVPVRLRRLSKNR